MARESGKFLFGLELKTLKAENDIRILTCLCPQCNQIFNKEIESEHYLSEYSWKENGLFKILCDTCKSKANFSIWFSSRSFIPKNSFCYEIMRGGFNL